MPVLTTNMLTKNPTLGAGPISQAVVKVVNNGTSRGVVYLTGLNTYCKSSGAIRPGAIRVELQGSRNQNI